MTNLKTLNNKVIIVLKSYKNNHQKIQEILEEFLVSFDKEDGLNKNSTPLDKLLQGVKKTDNILIREWFKRVSNTVVYLKADKKYVLKYSEDNIVLNDNFGTLKWCELAKKADITFKDSYKNIEEALKAGNKYFEKAIKTVKTDDEKKQLKDMFYSFMASCK